MFGARKICSFTVNLNQNLKHHLNQKATLLCQSHIFQQKMSYENNGLNADKLDISGMRKPYRGKHDIFDVSDLVSREPFEQFKSWFEEAKNTEGIMEANAMSLATSTKDGKPSVRMVLMKGIDEKGIVFYTNYLSQKAVELVDGELSGWSSVEHYQWSAPMLNKHGRYHPTKDEDENNAAALLFYWCSHSERCTVSRQVRIEGLVEKVTQEEATDYFHSRPRDSQIGACVSQQSQVIPNRKIIEERNLELQMKYSDSNTPIPKPDYWGGYRVIPNRFEFWQGQTNRLHDRIVFRRPLDGEQLNPDVTHAGVDGWVYERLMP